MGFPLFEEGWGADEELLLLEAIQMYGLGNWGEISEHVGTTKTPEACKEHYFTYYINCSSTPLPVSIPSCFLLLSHCYTDPSIAQIMWHRTPDMF